MTGTGGERNNTEQANADRRVLEWIIEIGRSITGAAALVGAVGHLLRWAPRLQIHASLLGSVMLLAYSDSLLRLCGDPQIRRDRPQWMKWGRLLAIVPLSLGPALSSRLLTSRSKVALPEWSWLHTLAAAVMRVVLGRLQRWNVGGK